MASLISTRTSRFPLSDPQSTRDPIVRDVYAAIERELGFGMVPNLFRALGTQPLVLRNTWNLFRDTILVGILPRTVKEMVGIVVSAAHASDYARDVHMHSLGVQGVAQATLALLAQGEMGRTELSATVIAMLRLADKAARQGPSAISDLDLAELSDVGVEAAELQELFATINLFSYVNSLTDLAQVPVDVL